MNLLPTAKHCLIATHNQGIPTTCIDVDGPMIVKQVADNGVDKIEQLEVWFEQSAIKTGSVDRLELAKLVTPEFSIELEGQSLIGQLIEVQQAALGSGGIMNRCRFQLVQDPKTLGLFAAVGYFFSSLFKANAEKQFDRDRKYLGRA